METTKQINTWALFYNPNDHPDKYVARRFAGTKPTEDCFIDESYTKVVAWIHDNAMEKSQNDLTKISRLPDDLPSVVEVWI